MDKQHFVEACRRGGRAAEQALRTLYRDYGGALRREAWLALRDAEAAAELLQDTLLKAWQRCASYRAESELFPWLRQIVRRGAIDELRRQRPEQSLDAMGEAAPAVIEEARRSEPGTAPVRPDERLQQAQHEQVYRRCAARFAAEQPQAAQVIRWVAEEGLQIAELAALLQRTPAATREHVSQCRKKARRYFAEWYALVAGEGGL
jgi:RNA polymerase sigma-70 factor (ECF subfamily)